MRPAGLCPVGVDIQLPMVESDSDPREWKIQSFLWISYERWVFKLNARILGLFWSFFLLRTQYNSRYNIIHGI
jgi:hypothetical protein